MPDVSLERRLEPWFKRLYLPTYRISDAARYVELSPQAVSNWHQRRLRSGATALPIREPGSALSYLQLVEVAVVAKFREVGVPLSSIANARDYFAQNFNSEFPFAEYRFKTNGYNLLMNLTEIEPKLKTDDLVVADKGGQVGWASMMTDRLFEFDYEAEYDLAMRWWVAGRESKVVIDPRIAFGAPMVKGIATWVLKGRWTAGETIEDIREDFGLGEDEVVDALRFEQIAA